jgi:hypothetical protein
MEERKVQGARWRNGVCVTFDLTPASSLLTGSRFLTFRSIPVFMDQWSTSNVQIDANRDRIHTCRLHQHDLCYCCIPSDSSLPQTHDNKLATHRNVCAMSSEAVAMVLVDRKYEASTKLWTVGSKLCGGWRKKVHSWMLGSLSASSSLDSENAIRRTGWAGGSWLEIGRKTLVFSKALLLCLILELGSRSSII